MENINKKLNLAINNRIVIIKQVLMQSLHNLIYTYDTHYYERFYNLTKERNEEFNLKNFMKYMEIWKSLTLYNSISHELRLETIKTLDGYIEKIKNNAEHYFCVAREAYSEEGFLSDMLP